MPLEGSMATDHRFASARLLMNARRPPAAVGNHADSLLVVNRCGATVPGAVNGTILCR